MLPELHTPIPGPRSLELAKKLKQYESQGITHTADDWPIFWERAEGTNVWDVDDNRFLDLTSAFGVCSLGHGDNDLEEAMVSQAGKLMHAMGDVHPSELKAELCEKLSAITFERWGAGVGKTILGNSGFEAVEAAMKTSVLHTGKPGVIAFKNGYHGLGMGTLAACGIPYFEKPFRAQMMDHVMIAPYPDHEDADLEKLAVGIEVIADTTKTGCVLVEPIQGRGGCIMPPPSFLLMLRDICDRRGLLLIVDEILTGLNRTGALFACDHAGVIPDMICIGKSLTGGYPLSACVGRASVMDSWPVSTGEALHTSTYLGNPVGCAMALASLKKHMHPMMTDHVRERGEKFITALEAIRSPEIAQVRGLGLMIGMEIVTKDGKPNGKRAIQIVKQGLQDGLILLADSPKSNVLSFIPPFSIKDDEIAFVANWLAGCFK